MEARFPLLSECCLNNQVNNQTEQKTWMAGMSSGDDERMVLSKKFRR
jgi:hypothetical protein